MLIFLFFRTFKYELEIAKVDIKNLGLIGLMIREGFRRVLGIEEDSFYKMVIMKVILSCKKN